jgi:hypothetical protein
MKENALYQEDFKSPCPVQRRENYWQRKSHMYEAQSLITETRRARTIPYLDSVITTVKLYLLERITR